MGNGFTHSGTCKKELESTIRKIVKEEYSLGLLTHPILVMLTLSQLHLIPVLLTRL